MKQNREEILIFKTNNISYGLLTLATNL